MQRCDARSVLVLGPARAYCRLLHTLAPPSLLAAPLPRCLASSIRRSSRI
jgi:hypothetical protein